jgi:endoglucanase
MAARILIVLGLAVAAALAAWLLIWQPAHADVAWERYKQRFLTAEGRIADSGNGGVSHTEGQGYAMVMATAYNDRAAFDRLWGWTRQTLRRPDGLFSWRYVPNADQPIPDRNNATDGDLMICWALLRAARQWHRPEDQDAALDIAASLRRAVVKIEDGQAYLLPGAEGFADPTKRIVNLSYWVFPALQDIAAGTRDPAWNQVIETGLHLIATSRFGTHNLPPDWLDTLGTPKPAETFPPRFGYDAVRIPLYLIWAHRAGAEQLGAIDAFWSSANPVPAWIDVTSGAVSPEAQSPGMTAVTHLALGTQLPPQPDQDDYYSASLWMLATLAKGSDAR